MSAGQDRTTPMHQEDSVPDIPAQAKCTLVHLYALKRKIGRELTSSPPSVSFRPTFFAFATGAQLLICIDAGSMPIFPDRCQTITAHRLYIYQRGLLNAQAFSAGKHSALAALAGTPGAGAGPAQIFPVVDTFMLIAPAEREQVLLLVQQKGGRSWMMIL
jgi:hypothetical protein